MPKLHYIQIKSDIEINNTEALEKLRTELKDRFNASEVYFNYTEQSKINNDER